MSLPAGAGYDTFIAPAPSGDLSEFTWLMDGSLFSDDFKSDINTTDPTRARYALNADETELAFDWMTADLSTDYGIIAINSGGPVYALSSDAARTLRGYAPNTRNTAYAAGDTYGQYNAYASNVTLYLPNPYDLVDRTGSYTFSFYGSSYSEITDGPMGNALRITEPDNSCIYTAQSEISYQTEYTFVGWYRTTNAFSRKYMFQLGDTLTDHTEFSVRQWTNSTQLFHIYVQNGLVLSTVTDDDETSWNHFAATDNLTDVALYLNGSLDASGTRNSTSWTNGYLSIGQMDSLSDDSDYADMWVFSEDIGADQIAYIYDNTVNNSTFWSTPTWVSGGSGTTATPDDLSADWSLGSPAAAVQIYTEPSDLSAGFSLGSPAVSVASSGVPDDLTASWEMESPAVSVECSVSPDDVGAQWGLGTPSASTGTMASPDDLEAGWALGSPVVSVQCEAVPDDLAAAWELGTPSAFTGVVASPDDLNAQWELRSPGVTVQFPADPDDLSASWDLGSPAVSVVCEAVPEDLAAAWELGSPRVNWVEVIIEAIRMETPFIRDFEMETPWVREVVISTPVTVIREET